jgi:hypothetical protein
MKVLKLERSAPAQITVGGGCAAASRSNRGKISIARFTVWLLSVATMFQAGGRGQHPQLAFDHMNTIALHVELFRQLVEEFVQ